MLRPCFVPPLFTPAFSLAEMMVALTLVGLLGAFSVPPLLQNIGEKQGRVALKASISELSQAIDKMASDGSSDATAASSTCNNPTFLRALVQRLETKKVCETNGIPNCMGNTTSDSTPATNFEFSTQPSLILPNDVVVGGICYPGGDAMVLDYNGGKGPNELGQDRIWINLNASSKANVSFALGGGGIGPRGAPSQTLYRQLFKGY